MESAINRWHPPRHVHRFVHGVAAATIIARVLADAARGCRQGIVEDHGFEASSKRLPYKLEEARNFICKGNYSRKGKAQVLADPGRQRWARRWCLKLMAEIRMVVSTGLGAVCPSRTGVSRNMRPSSFQGVQILFRSLPLGVTGSGYGALVETHAAGYTFAVRTRNG